MLEDHTLTFSGLLLQIMTWMESVLYLLRLFETASFYLRKVQFILQTGSRLPML